MEEDHPPSLDCSHAVRRLLFLHIQKYGAESPEDYDPGHRNPNILFGIVQFLDRIVVSHILSRIWHSECSDLPSSTPFGWTHCKEDRQSESLGYEEQDMFKPLM